MKNLPGTKVPQQHLMSLLVKSIFGLSVRRQRSPHTPWRVGTASPLTRASKEQWSASTDVSVLIFPFFPHPVMLHGCADHSNRPSLDANTGWADCWTCTEQVEAWITFSPLPPYHITPLMPAGWSKGINKLGLIHIKAAEINQETKPSS